jgi:hypothetical protein
LFHALFNLNDKRIGGEMVANAERLKQIPWEVYGGCKRHRAIECATNKVLTMDIARLEHRTMALCSNDAKSCYDRILHAIASICMRRVGVPKEMCQMMFGTLAQVDHYVRTNFGDSTRLLHTHVLKSHFKECTKETAQAQEYGCSSASL